jgi:sec-independent protein translocase protein TatA
MFSKLGGWEIVIILVIVLIIFGAGKLPQVGSAIGKGIRKFRKGQTGEMEEEETEPEKKKVAAAKRKKTTAKKSV